MAQDAAATQAKKKVSRVAVKKVKDKWKAKQWFAIRAPRAYNGIVIAETLSDEHDKLMGRVAEATLQDLTGDISKMHVKLYFKVNGVKGTECVTKFTGHELTSDYIRRLTRRKHSKVDTVIDVTTSDGWSMRIKPLAITEKRATSRQEAEIRAICQKIANDAAGARNVGDFVKLLVNGDLAQDMFKEARKIYPLKRVEIRKSQVTREPEALEPDMDVFAMPTTPQGEATETAPAAEGEAEAAMAEELAKGVEGAGEELVEEEQVGGDEDKA